MKIVIQGDLDVVSNLWMIAGDEQYRGAGGSSSGSPPASLLVVPQPLTVKPSHPSHLNSHLGGPHSHPPRKYQCKMCPQVSYTSLRRDVDVAVLCSLLFCKSLPAISCATMLIPSLCVCMERLWFIYRFFDVISITCLYKVQEMDLRTKSRYKCLKNIYILYM